MNITVSVFLHWIGNLNVPLSKLGCPIVNVLDPNTWPVNLYTDVVLASGVKLTSKKPVSPNIILIFFNCNLPVFTEVALPVVFCSLTKKVGNWYLNVYFLPTRTGLAE